MAALLDFLGGVLLNILLNWIMIYGKWGCPALGMNGAAWATLISRVMIFVALFVWLETNQSLRDWVPYSWFRKPLKADLLAHARIGLPASFQMLCEVGAFSAAGFMMGRFGEIAMAAHQIAITCASAAFMIPLGLAMALTVRTGSVAGAGETARLRAVVHSGWLLATAFGLLNAAAFSSPAATGPHNSPMTSASFHLPSPCLSSSACFNCSIACRWHRVRCCEVCMTRAFPRSWALSPTG